MAAMTVTTATPTVFPFWPVMMSVLLPEKRVPWKAPPMSPAAKTQATAASGP